MRYLLTVIAFIMGFSALPVWAMAAMLNMKGEYRSHRLRTKNCYPQRW